jgi:hypothetical protein
VASPQDDHLHIADQKNGTFHLDGNDLRQYLGKRVQVTGFRLGKLDVVGGLTPSPNVAGQAGAIDPSRAATAAIPGGAARTTEGTPVVEFQVRKIQTVKGTCP